MRYTLVLLFGLLLVVSPALGYFETGDSLKSNCSTDSDKCTGYISAVADTLGWTGCIPANVGTDTLRRIVLQYMNDHPEKARKVAFSVVTYALSEAYPCLVPYQKQTLATRKPQAKPSAASSPSATQVLDIAPAGVSGADRRSLAIHLASVRTKDGAEIGWNNLQRQFSELIGQRSLIIRSIEIEAQGTFFRIMTGPFETRSRAQDLCDEFKSREQYCKVLRLTDAR